jgi:hypothetical protein
LSIIAPYFPEKNLERMLKTPIALWAKVQKFKKIQNEPCRALWESASMKKIEI